MANDPSVKKADRLVFLLYYCYSGNQCYYSKASVLLTYCRDVTLVLCVALNRYYNDPVLCDDNTILLLYFSFQYDDIMWCEGGLMTVLPMTIDFSRYWQYSEGYIGIQWRGQCQYSTRDDIGWPDLVCNDRCVSWLTDMPALLMTTQWPSWRPMTAGPRWRDDWRIVIRRNAYNVWRNLFFIIGYWYYNNSNTIVSEGHYCGNDQPSSNDRYSVLQWL